MRRKYFNIAVGYPKQGEIEIEAGKPGRSTFITFIKDESLVTLSLSDGELLTLTGFLQEIKDRLF